MADQINIITRNMVALLFWLVITAISIAIHSCVVFSNYMASAAAFELLGYEMKPLSADALLGPYMGAFLGSSTLAHLYALSLAVTLAWSLFMVFHLGFRIFEMMFDQRTYVEQGDEASARLASRLIIRDVALIIFFIIPLAFALRWDLELFRYRSVCGALQIHDPAVATANVTNWALQLQARSHLFAWMIAKVGGWGYLAVTALACLALEFSFHKISESWARLLSGFQGILTQPPGPDQEMALYGYDEDGQPVYDPDGSIAYDVDGNPLNRPSPKHSPEVGADGAGAEPALEPPAALAEVHDGDHSDAHAADNLTEGDSGSQHAHRGLEGDGRHEVIASPTNERLTFADALAAPDLYHVDIATRQIWWRQYWTHIHGQAPESPDRAQAA
jgi:hypothetical protein